MSVDTSISLQPLEPLPLPTSSTIHRDHQIKVPSPDQRYMKGEAGKPFLLQVAWI